MWSVVAIASFLKRDPATIYRHVPAAEIESARLGGVARLREALFTRAMGGRTEKVNPDGSVTIVYLKSSDRLLQCALDRFEGKIKQEIEINPDPKVPANVSVALSDEDLKRAMKDFESNY